MARQKVVWGKPQPIGTAAAKKKVAAAPTPIPKTPSTPTYVQRGGLAYRTDIPGATWPGMEEDIAAGKVAAPAPVPGAVTDITITPMRPEKAYAEKYIKQMAEKYKGTPTGKEWETALAVKRGEIPARPALPSVTRTTPTAITASTVITPPPTTLVPGTAKVDEALKMLTTSTFHKDGLLLVKTPQGDKNIMQWERDILNPALKEAGPGAYVTSRGVYTVDDKGKVKWGSTLGTVSLTPTIRVTPDVVKELQRVTGRKIY